MEPQVRINDPQEDKALDGWIDKIQNLVEEKDNYANDLVRTLGASLLPAGGGGGGGAVGVINKDLWGEVTDESIMA